ncbi:hypothetical protein PVAND_009767 [Polypedilum vanderplanki]|uniref:Flavin-containing monooxygenase n=1 Tax=Polypedilum vanderplanki TaxID=319348 RepID=A0A9J6CE83_POLVA|nr:hypothetical protein PVAND_009767 [Polypedilum vanderplanki]
MRICVIGAGVAGLCSIKRAIEYHCEVMAFEQSAEIGGTWVLREEIGKDKFGLNVHSSMYKGLRTDIPKEVMSYPDFPYPTKTTSYIPSSDVLDYLNAYANKFDLLDKIKFQHNVIRVCPLADNSWEVIVRNLPKNSYEIFIFDAVFVCTGNFHTPNSPIIKGNEIFKGKQIHSHDYCDAEQFRNEKVCIIGSGPTGIDVVQAISKTAHSVIWSTHLKQQLNITLADNVIMKPDIAELCSNRAIFVDGSYENFTILLQCTGYKHSFPFLSVDCDVVVEENFVSPLYKHCLNINRPTLTFIGLPTVGCNNQLFDYQVRFCLKFMTQQLKLPTKEEMLRDYKKNMEEQWKRGLSKRRAHLLGFDVQEKYFEELSTIAQLEPVKPVILKIFNKSILNLFSNLDNYREKNFKVINDEEFKEF